MVELEHLERDAVLEPVHARDAVAELEHGADLGEVRLDVELLDPLAQDGGDLFWTQLHPASSLSLRKQGHGHLARRGRCGGGRGGRARSRRGASSRPGGRGRRSGPGRRCASPAPCGRRPARSGRRCGRTPRRRASFAVVSSTSRTFSSRGDERLELRGDLADLAGAALLDERAGRSCATSSSASPSTRSSTSAFTRDSVSGFVEQRRRARAPRRAWRRGRRARSRTTSSLPALLRRPRRARARRCGARRL